MSIEEIAPDVYRISIFFPEADMQFNHFLVKDDEPLLFHAGMRAMFPQVCAAVARVIDPAALRWVGFSHFEADECGALNDWLQLAPSAQPLCSPLGALVNVNDFALRPARGLAEDEVLTTGKYRFRMLGTPHVPHGWDASMLFEETRQTLFCSDLFYQSGDVEARTEADVVGRFREGLIKDQQGPFAQVYPYTAHTDASLNRLAALAPKTLAIMHGSAYVGDGRRALHDLAGAMREILAR